MKILSLILTIVVIVLIFFSLNNSTTSQNNLSNFYEDKNYKEGEVIVMFKSNINANAFVNNYQDIDLRIKEVLVKDLNIYLFEYNVTKSFPVDALTSVMRNNDVAIAQFNHYVTERSSTFPNDTRFNEQWDKHNTGQSGGIPDADIDGPEAWDITTGGLTTLGDTIVVAIVDGGQQIGHQDLDTWRNWRETPANGVDDDNNGYIDDVNGWNASSNNGTIPANQHGSHCAGIAGAKGNNNQGVAGVNWKVKTMPVVYGSSPTLEQGVIRAYGYALKQRKIYNQTNGVQGAFVVSTNSSFGVDFGLPANYPLWCAFYDSLGAAGILSAGAGPNLNVNIDIVGDIPTACPSNFMIAVTNTTRTDARNSGAGYGPINMDLGAPGTSILSTTPNNSYGTLTGTSMATPQVTGAVGLLYSGASSVFIQLAKNDPDSAALLFKQYILSSVDTIPALTGITVSNGRLNIYKMLQKVIPKGRLDLTTFVEGFYNASLDKMITDTVRIYLRNTSSPYSIVDSGKGLLDSNGKGSFYFNNVANGVNYFIQLKHRNSIETWSAAGQSFTNSLLTYNFSTANTQAFGNNMIQVDASPVRFAIYSGDVNQDAYVNVLDLGLVYNDVQNSLSGYVNTDLTGDGSVDAIDLGLAYNNSNNSVGVRNPIVGDSRSKIVRR